MKRIALLLVLLFSSCTTVQSLAPPAEEYVQADILFYNFMGPFMRAAVEKDEEISPGTKMALMQAIDNWAFMVKTAAAAHGREFALLPVIPGVTTRHVESIEPINTTPMNPPTEL